jgi:putative endonuclease
VVPARHRKHELAQALRAGSSFPALKNIIMFYTYVLRSVLDNNLYIGYTDDLTKRIQAHDKGLVQATKNRRPLKLVYYEACDSKEKALLREKYFKTGFGRRYLKSRI